MAIGALILAVAAAFYAARKRAAHKEVSDGTTQPDNTANRLA